MYASDKMSNLTERLNKILDKITDKDFLRGKGLGNEISFHIFDYPPENELQIREHIQFLKDRIKKQHTDIKVLHINLFQFIIRYLKEKNILEKSFSLEQKKGTSELLKALKAPLKAENLVTLIRDTMHPQDYDLVLIDGVGSIWPLVRAHSLLNNLQPVMGDTPLVLYYPGNYDGQVLRLFGRVDSGNYYRAFRLVT
jgi:hypothetical protein|tara:strand:- start:556 stop:1146 length:591 start_codon:yes stop_codon:yes gene_type:complete